MEELYVQWRGGIRAWNGVRVVLLSGPGVWWEEKTDVVDEGKSRCVGDGVETRENIGSRDVIVGGVVLMWENRRNKHCQ